MGILSGLSGTNETFADWIPGWGDLYKALRKNDSWNPKSGIGQFLKHPGALYSGEAFDSGTSGADMTAAAKQLLDTYGGDYFQNLYDTLSTQAQDIYGTGGDKNAGWYANQADKYSTIPTQDDWMSSHGYTYGDTSGEQAAISDLLALLENPDTAWGAQAGEHAAGLLGFADTASFDAAKQAAQQRLAGGVDQYAGLSASERALRERANRSNLRDIEARAQRMVQNTMADTGSTARMLAKADEANRSISNLSIQQDMQLAQDDFERKTAAMNQDMAMYDRMVQTGQMGYNDYMQMRTSAANSALAGYAQKMDATMRQNEQYLSQYTADRDAMNQQFQTMISLSNHWAGLETEAINWINARYDAQKQPILDQIALLQTAQDLSPDLLSQLSQLADLITSIAGVAAAVA